MLQAPSRRESRGVNARSAVAYRDVGEGREQEAEASPARIAARTPLCN